MTNYEKASTLLSLGYASKLDATVCLTFDLGYSTSSFGFIYPNDTNVTVILDNNNINSDYGFIDLDTMSIIGTKDNYSIEKYWRKQGTEEQLFPLFLYLK